MAIETLDDVIDQLADWIGVYGAHEDGTAVRSHDELHCRVCFMSVMRQRIEAALEAERSLARGRALPETVSAKHE